MVSRLASPSAAPPGMSSRAVGRPGGTVPVLGRTTDSQTVRRQGRRPRPTRRPGEHLVIGSVERSPRPAVDHRVRTSPSGPTRRSPPSGRCPGSPGRWRCPTGVDDGQRIGRRPVRPALRGCQASRRLPSLAPAYRRLADVGVGHAGDEAIATAVGLDGPDAIDGAGGRDIVDGVVQRRAVRRPAHPEVGEPRAGSDTCTRCFAGPPAMGTMAMSLPTGFAVPGRWSGNR